MMEYEKSLLCTLNMELFHEQEMNNMSILCKKWRKYHKSAPGIFNLLIKMLVFSSACYFLSFITADTDLWGHIKFGEHLWLSKAFARVDIYSYTAYGREWFNHEWLSELLMYAVFTIFGSPGLLVGKLTAGLIIIVLLSTISFHRTHNPLVYGFVFVIAIFIMSPGFMTRPQILSFLFTALYLFIFHLYFERQKNLLWLMPLVMILWVNSHGGFLIGAGILPVVLGSEIITGSFKKRKKGDFRLLIFWCVMTEISVLANPYGYRLLVFLYQSLSLPRNIGEWEAVGILDFSYLRFKLFAILVLVTLFLQREKNRYWEIGIIIIVLVFAFRHQRHTPIFAIAATPYLAEKLSILAKRINLFSRIKSSWVYVILNTVVVLLIGFQLYHASSRYIRTGFNIIVDPKMYPVYAVHFLKQNKIKGNILLPFEWGEYAIWKLHPDCKVSIDGRFRTAYPEEVLDDHIRAAADGRGWKKVMDKYPSDIILARRDPFFQQMISGQEKWIYVYSDSISMIFVKKGDAQREVLTKLEKKKLIYPTTKLSIYFP